MKKTEKICLVGPSGSGKTYVIKTLIKKGESYSPRITTRPIRKGENNGIDYNFISNLEFQTMLEESKIKLYQTFNIKNEIWYYALSNENFETNNIFALTPYEITLLTKEERSKCFVIYLDIDENVRRRRLSGRVDNNDSVERRINSDRIDFLSFCDYDMKISDENFEVDMILTFAF